MASKAYWNRNLDTDNLSRRRGAAHGDIEASCAFARTPEFEWLRGRLGETRDKTVVDLGGGIGMHALLWAGEGARVIVVDPALERIKALREIARRAKVADRLLFVAGCAEALPFSPESADIMFTKSVLIHTNLSSAAAEIYRVLKPGGRGAFIEPLHRNPIIRVYRRLFAPRIWRRITRYFDPAAMRELRAPFGTLRWKGFYLLSAGSFFWQYGFRNLSRFQKSLRFWRGVDCSILQRLPQLESWCWFAAIEVQKEAKPAVEERRAP